MTSPRDAWYETAHASQALLTLMDTTLNERLGMPLAWYDLLISIDRHPHRAPRMAELAERVVLSRSWLSRRVAEVERADLVCRRPDPHDGRGTVVTLTKRGEKALAQMQVVQTELIGRIVVPAMTAREANTVATVMRRIMNAIET